MGVGTKETYGNFMRQKEQRILLETLREKVRLLDEEKAKK